MRPFRLPVDREHNPNSQKREHQSSHRREACPPGRALTRVVSALTKMVGVIGHRSIMPKTRVSRRDWAPQSVSYGRRLRCGNDCWGSTVDQDLWKLYRAVLALAVLKQSNQSSAHCHRSAIQRMEDLRLSAALWPHTDAESTGLKIGRIRARCEFAPAALSGQPCFAVKFLCG